MPDLKDIPVFVINLEGSDTRLRSAKEQLDRAGLSFRRIDAVDGRGRQPDDFPEYDAKSARRFFGRGLKSGEIGCYLSHVAAARALIESRAPSGLIFEDDFLALPDAWRTVSETLKALDEGSVQNWEIVNLARAPRMVVDTFSQLSGGRRLMRAYYFPVVATAMLWSRAGALRFVTEAAQPIAPVDHMYRRMMSQSGLGLALDPVAFSVLGADSDIALASGTLSTSQQPDIAGKLFKKYGEAKRQVAALSGALTRKWFGSRARE